MASRFERFFEKQRYAIVGHSAKCAFPRLTYNALKQRGSTVYAIDPSVDAVEGDPAFPDFDALPGPIEGVILEVPKEETATWVDKAAAAGVKDVWIHMKRDTPEALAKAAAHDMDVRTGTCAVQYVSGGFPHNVHRFLRKLAGRW